MYIRHFFLKLTQHNTSPLLSQPVDAVWGNNRFLLWKYYGTHTRTYVHCAL